jgi:tyrosyl-tRNA synthetase
MTTQDFLTELSWRGLLHQVTHEHSLREHLQSGPRAGYCGFDPTADSLTIGNFIAIKLLMHFQWAGHSPVVIIGGGTGLIGDPSGKSAERPLLTVEDVERNIAGQRRIFERLLDFSSTNRARIYNNYEWLSRLGYLEVLRDIGKHFSVNAMIQRDAVRERLQREQGISYTEFSYMVLQAYDYLHLFRHHGVTLQMAGSDQWGNVVSGCDLIRRLCQQEVFGLTAPLITRADGTKFGKSEGGAIWLTADRTSPYQLYQFFLNTDDADVIRYLRLFTFLPGEEIAALEAAHLKDPGAREPHRALARQVTEMLHGPTECDLAEAASQALFSGDVAHLPERLLREIFSSVPSSEHEKALLAPGLPIVDALMLTDLVKSKREARDLLQASSITVNGHRVGPDFRVTTDCLLHGTIIAFRRGKKAWHVTRWR